MLVVNSFRDLSHRWNGGEYRGCKWLKL